MILFFVLYRNYIWGPYYYCFQDIGSDTIRSYLPYYRFLIENLRNGTFQMMPLQLGLGISAVTLTMQWLDPFSLFLFFVPLDRFMEAMIWLALLKYLVIACFSWLYFKRIVHNSCYAWVGVMLWTFSSYNVLWGQHYLFLTAMTFFTVNMYLLELLLAGKKSSFLFCVLNYALLSMFSVYFFCMIGIFSAFYLLARSLLCGFCLKKWLAGELQLLLNGVLGFMISAWISVPWLMLFGQSSRSDAGSQTLTNLFTIVSFKDVMLYLGRLISNNYFGVLSYSAQYNYYEAAILTSSVMIFWAVGYYLMCRPKWQYWLIAGMMVFPLFVLVFRYSFYFRWTCVLIFSLIVIIVSFLERCLKEPERNRQTNVFAMLFFFFVLVVLYAHFSVWSSVLSYVIIIFGIYLCLLALVATSSRYRRILPLGLIVAVFFELFCMHNPTINLRLPLERLSLFSQIFEKNIYKKVKPVIEDSIRDGRILFVPSFDKSQFYSMPLVFNYSGGCAYNSLLPKVIRNYSPETLDVHNTNRFSFYPEPAMELLLGVGTQVSIDSKEKLFGYVEPENWNGVWRFKRKTSLPLGYLYTNRIDKDKLGHYAKDEFPLVRLSHFYFMRESDARSLSGAFPESIPIRKKLDREVISLIRNGQLVSTENQVILPKLPFIGRNDSISISIAVPRVGFHTLEIECDSGGTPLEFVLFCDGHLRAFQGNSGHGLYKIALPSEKVSSLRLVPFFKGNGKKASMKLISLSLVCQKGMDEIIDAAGAELKKYPVTDITYSHSTWHGKVDNHSGKQGMLCIPISFQEGWQATVSGKPEKVYDINNGLLGIPIPPGEHEVTVSWSAPGAYLGNILSILGILITGGLCFLFMRRKYKLRRRIEPEQNC